MSRMAALKPRPADVYGTVDSPGNPYLGRFGGGGWRSRWGRKWDRVKGLGRIAGRPLRVGPPVEADGLEAGDVGRTTWVRFTR
jgi:hypothetical protein